MKNRIMIVDDDKEFLEELEETLGLSGYDVVAVQDSTCALETMHQIKPDLILLDLKMPQKSGFQLADEVRHMSDLSQVPIIIMTAYLKDEYKSLMSLCGIHACLKKPFNPLDIIAQIESLLKR